jgi:BMFP domain-containing protein YqiC
MPPHSAADTLSFLLFDELAPPAGTKSAHDAGDAPSGTHHNEAPRLGAHYNSANQTTGRLTMDKPNFFQDLQAKINQAIENSPAKDIEKNVKAMLNQGFSKLDLVTREEFDVQAQVLAKTRAKLEALETRVEELEALLEAQRQKTSP